MLRINNCPVADLRPLRKLTKLGHDDQGWGLDFLNTMAGQNDPKIEEISYIQDNVERVRQLQAYLEEHEPPQSADGPSAG